MESRNLLFSSLDLSVCFIVFWEILYINFCVVACFTRKVI